MKSIISKNEMNRVLILLSGSFEDADRFLCQKVGLKTDVEKIEYLKRLFDVRVVHRTDDDIHTDYVAMLTSIVEHYA